jgi:hypothetical protein
MAGPAFLQPTIVYYIDTLVNYENKDWSLVQTSTGMGGLTSRKNFDTKTHRSQSSHRKLIGA